MYLTDGNPVLKRQDEIKSKLNEGQRKALDSLYDDSSLGFVVLKRTRREKKVGDVFVCSVQDGVYFYGKILNACVKHNKFDDYNGCIVVCIYKENTDKKTLDDFKGNVDDLLVEPTIVYPQYWSKGYLETIGNVPLTNEEENLDYGFWDRKVLGDDGYFVKEDGTYLDHEPKHFSLMGITLYLGLYKKIKKALIIDPSLGIVKKN